MIVYIKNMLPEIWQMVKEKKRMWKESVVDNLVKEKKLKNQVQVLQVFFFLM